MKWTPELDEEEQQQYRAGYISDQTAYMRMQTQLEKRDTIIDDTFLKKYKARILGFDKFAPLSNSPPSQIKIDRIRRLKLDLLEEAGLPDDAVRCALDNVGDYQSFRGMGGFFQTAQITERHEIKQEETEKKRLSGLSGLFKKKPPEETEERK